MKNVGLFSIIFFCGLSMAISLPYTSGQNVKGLSVNPLDKISLFELFSRSADIILRNPEGIAKCTEEYKETITEITQEYEDGSKGCTTKAESERAKVEKESEADQKDLAKRTNSVCENISKCQDLTTASLKLECFANEGLEGSKALTKVSNDAKKISLSLNEALRRIDSEERTCMAENKLKFESASAQATDDLNACMFESLNPPITV
uniref:Putative secreted protein n=1 Tax=Haematobia irritans TaxID=7368 RepID=A0A1L8EBJ2_HAEIR